MKVAATITSLVGAALLTLPFAVASAPAAAKRGSAAVGRAHTATPGTGPYGARLVACRRSPDADLRSVTVAASIRPIAGGRHLALRVDLLQRSLSGGRWMARSDVPGLGTWTAPSDPSIGTRANDVYKFRQAVGRLDVPYAYRFRIGFRWTDATGAIVREETQFTVPCRQPDVRPNLSISDVTVLTAADPARAQYRVTVRNGGRSAAVGFRVTAVTFTAAPRTIKRLAPQETASVVFTGPACASGAPGPAFLVDGDGAVDESDETDNGLVATCPATLRAP